MPQSILIVVDFPAPFGPRRARSSTLVDPEADPVDATLATRSGRTMLFSAPATPVPRTAV